MRVSAALLSLVCGVNAAVSTTCNYQLRSDAPKTLRCAGHGSLSAAAPLGDLTHSASNLACLSSCISTKSCQSYGYSKTAKTCQLYSKTINSMGFKKSAEHKIVFYNKRCYEQVCKTTCLQVPTYTGEEGQPNYVTFQARKDLENCPRCYLVDPFDSMGDVDLALQPYLNSTGKWTVLPQDKGFVKFQNLYSNKVITAGYDTGSDIYQEAGSDGLQSQLWGYSLDNCRFYPFVGGLEQPAAAGDQGEGDVVEVYLAPDLVPDFQEDPVFIDFAVVDPSRPATYVTRTHTYSVPSQTIEPVPSPTSTFIIQITEMPAGATGDNLQGIPLSTQQGSPYAMSFEWLGGFQMEVGFSSDPSNNHIYWAPGFYTGLTNVLSMFTYGYQDPYPVTLAIPEDPLAIPLECSVDNTTQVLSCSASYNGQTYSNWVVGANVTALYLSSTASNTTLVAAVDPYAQN